MLFLKQAVTKAQREKATKSLSVMTQMANSPNASPAAKKEAERKATILQSLANATETVVIPSPESPKA